MILTPTWGTVCDGGCVVCCEEEGKLFEWQVMWVAVCSVCLCVRLGCSPLGTAAWAQERTVPYGLVREDMVVSSQEQKKQRSLAVGTLLSG